MSDGAQLSRREFAAFGWLPFLHPHHIRLAGARFRIIRNGRSKRRYLRIHGNEETARLVLERHMELHEGIAYIIESQVRNTQVDGLKLDPNRMFSRIGAEASLKNLNRDAPPDQMRRALHTLDAGREHLVRALTPPRGGLLIAVHNNSEGYSVNSEVPISDQTSLRQPAQPHAFLLCTDPADFEVLKSSPYNVVLQQQGPKQDDGSFSRLAAARGIRYVNLEVHLGERERQREMLDWVESKLP
ncbi:MAG: hypothetical protein JWP63_5995 [Candidatus Solibacter sp.]|jgi:hypothetical protein|nr:hypothetical protein [Candidatus Solibacter sp.]